MKSLRAGIWLTLASFVVVSISPCLAQDATSTTTTTTVSTAVPTTTTTTSRHHFRKQKAKKAKKIKYKKHRVSSKNLSGGVSKKHKWGKNKTYSSSQQKRLDKLNSALNTPKHYNKMPELSTPGGANSTQAAPGL